MKYSIALSLVSAAFAAQADDLRVVTYASPARSVTYVSGNTAAYSDLQGLPLGDGVSSTRVFPGCVSLRISGGSAPYEVIWHDQPENTLIQASLMPGTHHVTVVDANGEHVNATVNVGLISQVRRLESGGEAVEGRFSAAPTRKSASTPATHAEMRVAKQVDPFRSRRPEREPTPRPRTGGTFDRAKSGSREPLPPGRTGGLVGSIVQR